MGDAADYACQDFDFPDVMYDQVHGYSSDSGPPQQHDEVYDVNDIDEMLRRDRGGKAIETTKDDCWIYFGALQSSLDIAKLAGKYLFFSKYQTALVAIAEVELWEHGFEAAKVSADPRAGDYVLCLYWTSDERKHELAVRYTGRPEIKYRWWKSNEDTRAGKYKTHRR